MPESQATTPLRCFFCPKPRVRLQPVWSRHNADPGKTDATLLALKLQEDCGIHIVTDGERSRTHFVEGFLSHLEGIDNQRRQVIGVRANRYEAEVPTVVGPIKRKGFVHRAEALLARARTTRQLKFTLPGPMTIIDTVANVYYKDKAELAFALAEALNEEARDLERSAWTSSSSTSRRSTSTRRKLPTGAWPRWSVLPKDSHA